MLALMKKFTSAFSVSGAEKELAELIESELKDCTDNISRDAMGNVIAYKKGVDSSKKMMIAAHMDEIGFVVTYIDDKGFLRVSNIGGINPVCSSYQTVAFANGVKGVIVADAAVSAGDLKVKDLVVDIGAKNKKNAEKKVSVGDVCAIIPSFTKLLNGRYSAKAFDDRLGCVVAVLAAQAVEKPAYDTYYVFTVQEEVGCRGSKPSAFAIAPDYAIAIDVTRTGDAVGVPAMAVKLGEGAAVKLKDSSVICSKVIVNAMIKSAEKNKIKYQLEILEGGGTDTSSMQVAAGGSCAGCISVPTRYIHSPVEVVDVADVKASVELLKAVITEGI